MVRRLWCDEDEDEDEEDVAPLMGALGNWLLGPRVFVMTYPKSLSVLLNTQTPLLFI